MRNSKKSSDNYRRSHTINRNTGLRNPGSGYFDSPDNEIYSSGNKRRASGSKNEYEKREPVLPLEKLKGLRTGVFSDGREHTFTNQELHLSSGNRDEDINIPSDSDMNQNTGSQKSSHRNDNVRYNPAFDTDVNYNGRIIYDDPDSVFVSRGGMSPSSRRYSDDSCPKRSFPGKKHLTQSYPGSEPLFTEDDFHMDGTPGRGGHFRSPYSSYNNYCSRKLRKAEEKRKLIITLSVIAAIAAAVLICFICVKSEISNLKSKAYDLKDSLKVTFEAVKDLDPDGVEASLTAVEKSCDEILETLDEPFWKTAAIIGPVETDINTIKGLVDTVGDAEVKIFEPFINQMRTHPMSDLKVDGGFNTSVILTYLDFFDEISEEIDNISNRISKVEFKTIKVNAFDEYAEKFTQLFSTFDTVKDYTPLIRALIGSGEDKLYLVMAQNSAEIRASGGFPGSMGTIRIKDGILSIGEFSSVLDHIYSPIMEESGITTREYELFGYMYCTWAHDACYNMHFARVAEITRVAYEYANSESLDGIIAMTPVVIQRLLKIADRTITLEDGTELNGDNATKVLQHDMYYKYQADDATAEDNNVYIDPLFNETAKKTMSILTDDFDYTKLSDYLEFFREGFSDRTILLWFADSDNEQIAIDAGCSGNLNSDPEKPVSGIYFSLSDPGKLGMFISIDMEIINTQKLDDGSTEYTIEAHYTNTITDEDMNAGTWLLGNYDGAIQCSIYLTAPMGGTIYGLEDNTAENSSLFTLSEYQGIQLYYAQYVYIYPGYPVTTRFKVTTAPGVETPLTLEKTPTLQEYIK